MADAINETVVTGKSYRVLTDASDHAWDKISMWTKASDVEIDKDAFTTETLQTFVDNTKDAIGDIDASIANVESTSTASKAYVVGDRLVYNDTLYKVTAPIASGATLTVGTNIVADTVDDYVKAQSTTAYNRLKDTVGHVSKNLLPYPYPNTSMHSSGIAYHEYSDGRVMANRIGSSTSQSLFYYDGSTTDEMWLNPGDYIFSGCPEGGTSTTYRHWMRIYHSDGTDDLVYDFGEGVSFTILDTDINIRCGITIEKGSSPDNLMFYPMIRRADVTDGTWEPYSAHIDESVDGAFDNIRECGSKNLIPFPWYRPIGDYTAYRVTWTCNADQTIHVVSAEGASSNSYYSLYTGKSNTDYSVLKPNTAYKLVVCVSGSTGRVGAYVKDLGSSNAIIIKGITEGQVVRKFVMPSSYVGKMNIAVYVDSDDGPVDLTVKVMLIPANDTDYTWTPYVPKNSELLSYYDNGILGAKNLLPYPWYHTTKSSCGVDFVDVSDGTLQVSGTNDGTGDSWFTLISLSRGYYATLPAGAYTFSGCPSGASASTYFMRVAYSYDGVSNKQVDFYEDTIISLSEQANVGFAICVKKGCPAISSAITFKPMITLASDSDPTFRPYAKTNKELTDLITSPGWIDVSDTVTDAGNTYVTSARSVQYTEIGRFVYLHAAITFSRSDDLAFGANGFTIGLVNCPGLPDALTNANNHYAISCYRGGSTHLNSVSAILEVSTKKIIIKGCWGFPDIDGVSYPAIPANENVTLVFDGMYPKA